jgi:hypothetical protein
LTEPLNKPSAANGCSSGKTAGLLIAVFADGDHSPAVPYEAERVVFFAKRGGAWTETASQQIQPLDGTAPDAAASFLAGITTLVEDAQAVAGASVSGQLYAALNRLGKHIFELSIICRHLPPWLPLETELTVRQKQRGEYLIVTVTKRQRGEAAL